MGEFTTPISPGGGLGAVKKIDEVSKWDGSRPSIGFKVIVDDNHPTVRSDTFLQGHASEELESVVDWESTVNKLKPDLVWWARGLIDVPPKTKNGNKELEYS